MRNHSAHRKFRSLLPLLAVFAAACGGDDKNDSRSGGPSTFGSGPRVVLGKGLGEYLTIEGVRAEKGMVGPRDMIVDTIDGKKLATPVHIGIRNVDLPVKQRCVLKGYETGEMIGTPPAAQEAAKEQGREAKIEQAGWGWYPLFVVLIVVEPKGLEISRER